jgi:hypothetical protein
MPLRRMARLLGHLTAAPAPSGTAVAPTAAAGDTGDTGDLAIRSASSCEYDGCSIGEVMMRLDPGFYPTRRAKEFGVSHGGGEANVVYGLSSCFGMRCTLLTALVDDGIGRNIETQIKEGGVDTSNFVWFNTKNDGLHSTDGKGTLHNGINVTYNGERGSQQNWPGYSFARAVAHSLGSRPCRRQGDRPLRHRVLPRAHPDDRPWPRRH